MNTNETHTLDRQHDTHTTCKRPRSNSQRSLTLVSGDDRPTCKRCAKHWRRKVVLFDPTPHVREGYTSESPRQMSSAFGSLYLSSAPSVGNGRLTLRKVRIVVELINEPIEVLRDRLRKLWCESEYNSHQHSVMRDAAEELGMAADDLKFNEQGRDFVRRNARSVQP